MARKPTKGIDDRTRANRLMTARRSANQHEFVGRGQSFARLPMPVKAAWQDAANIYNEREGRTGRRILTAANVHTMLNTARAAVGLSRLDVCPADLSPPPPFGDVELRAVWRETGVRLTLISDGFAAPVQVLGFAPSIPGKRDFVASGFVPLCHFPSLPAGNVDISDSYQARFGRVPEGSLLAVKLSPVGENGVRGVACIVTCEAKA